MLTYQALNILLFLFPGFVCIAVLDVLTPASKRDSFQRIIQALMYSFVIYAFFAIAFGESPVFLVEESIGTEKQFSVNFAKGSLAFLLAVSILIPIAISASIKRDLHMKFLRWLRVTDRTSRTNVWFDVFTDIKSYIIVNFEDGRRLYGWPEYFSDDPQDKSLFLCHAAWIDDNGKFIKLENRGILITPNETIDTIEFVKLKEG